MALGKHGGQAKPTDTAATLACRGYSSKRGKTTELAEKWFKYCRAEIRVDRDIKFGREELAHYYFAQAVFTFEGDHWNTYRTGLFDRLQGSQNKDGSWPASDGISVGPVYSTAMWCTILQLDKRSHPSMARHPEIVD